MEYQPQYQHPPAHQQHPQGHLQNYSASPQNPAISSAPSAAAHHSSHTQASPILPSQQHLPQQGGQGQQGHPHMGYQQYPHQPMHNPQYAAAQAAAMAAASGNYGSYSMNDPNMAPNMGVAPGMSGDKGGRDPRSPQQMQGPIGGGPLPSQIQSGQMMGGRRMSQSMASPNMGNAKLGMHQQQRPGQRPMNIPPPVPHAPAQDVAPPGPEEAPLYVNAKQFHRILKRRVARQKLEEALRLTNKGRKPYLHESRHNHAMRRPRGPGGRFLTAEEVAEMERKGEAPSSANMGKENVGAKSGARNGGKRKADEDSSTTPSKKNKTEQGSEDDDGEEDDES